MVWGKRSHDAEVTAVFIALDWAIGAGYEEINIYTDDKSIPESLYGARKGKGMGDLPAMINESTAEINIIHIPRKENQNAHKLCDKAYESFLYDNKFPKRGKKLRTFMTREAILNARKKGRIRAVNIGDKHVKSIC